MGEWAKCCCGSSLKSPGPSRLLASETQSQEELCCLQTTLPNAGASLSSDVGGYFLLHLVADLPNTLNLAQRSLWTLCNVLTSRWCKPLPRSLCMLVQTECCCKPFP